MNFLISRFVCTLFFILSSCFYYFELVFWFLIGFLFCFCFILIFFLAGSIRKDLRESINVIFWYKKEVLDLERSVNKRFLAFQVYQVRERKARVRWNFVFIQVSFANLASFVIHCKFSLIFAILWFFTFSSFFFWLLFCVVFGYFYILLLFFFVG